MEKTNPNAPSRRQGLRLPRQNSPQNRLKVLLTLLGLAAVAALGVTGYRFQQARQQKYLRSMNVAQLEPLVKQDPKSVEKRYALAHAYERENRDVDACREFAAALELEPTRYDILNDLGVSYIAQERYYEALVALQGALTAKPNYPPALANLGRLHIATKMPFTAVKELEQSLKLEPNNVPAMCDLGQAYIRTLNYNSAKDIYGRALRIEPKSPIALLGLGQALYSMTDYANAEKVLNQALAITPDDTAVLLALARLYIDRSANASEAELAQKTLEKILKTDPKDADAYFQLGKLLLRQGKNAEALEMQKNALRLAPEHIGVRTQLERCLRAVGRKADAERLAAINKANAMRERKEMQLEERVSRVPDDWDARADLVEVYLASGKRPLATLVLKAIKEQKPDHPRLPLLLRAMNPQQGTALAPSFNIGAER